MDTNRLTEKSQEALQAAQTKAIRHGHVEVDGEHLLLALVEQADGLVPRLLQRMDVPVDALRSRIEQELARKPRVSGPGAEAGKVYVTQRLSKLLVKAEDEAAHLKDEYVSVEHIFLAFVEEGSSTAAGRILQEFHITRELFLKTLIAVRGHQRVTSATPETHLRSAAEIRTGPGRGSPQQQAGPGHRPRRRNSAGDPHPQSQNQEQPGADR